MELLQQVAAFQTYRTSPAISELWVHLRIHGCPSCGCVLSQENVHPERWTSLRSKMAAEFEGNLVKRTFCDQDRQSQIIKAIATILLRGETSGLHDLKIALKEKYHIYITDQELLHRLEDESSQSSRICKRQEPDGTWLILHPDTYSVCSEYVTNWSFECFRGTAFLESPRVICAPAGSKTVGLAARLRRGDCRTKFSLLFCCLLIKFDFLLPFPLPFVLF